MEIYLIYVLKSAILLSIFWIIYTVFLKKETFFNLNRYFLILGIVTALLLPVVKFQRMVHIHFPSVIPFENPVGVIAGVNVESPNYWTYLFGLYILGASVVAARFIMELLSLKRILRKGRLVKKVGKVSFIEVEQEVSPFSFLSTIVYNPDLHLESELDTILKHENIHISQKHSVDMLLASLIKIILWFNPISWNYKKQLAQNLEYIADDQSCTLADSSKKDYQYLLLKQLSGNSFSVINPFFNSLIKKRIVMLQKQRSNKRSSWKYFLVLPFLAGFMLLFSFKTQVNYLPIEASSPLGINVSQQAQDSLPPLYVINGEKQPSDFKVSTIAVDDIESISVLKNESATQLYGEQGKNGVIHITLKPNNSTTDTSKKTVLQVPTKSISGKPLIIVNDRQMPDDFDINSIDKYTIKSVDVIKEKKATEKYGNNAKDGVIKIYTKDHQKK